MLRFPSQSLTSIVTSPHTKKAVLLLPPNAERKERGLVLVADEKPFRGKGQTDERWHSSFKDHEGRSSRPAPSSIRAQPWQKHEYSAREAAVRQLIRIEEEGQYVSHPTDAANFQAVARASNALSPREQATMKNLVSGVTRMKRRLDYVLSKLTSRNMATVEPGVRQVLRLALFELEYESLAPHALDEHVELARQVTSHSAGYAPGFVNAVLREAGRRAGAKMLPSPQDDLEKLSASTRSSERGLARGLSLLYSHPTWLASRWLKRFGRQEAEALMDHNNRHPVYTVRVNALKGTTVDNLLPRLQEEGIQAQASTVLPNDFIEITSGLQTLLAKGYVARGECLVQDVSAGLVIAAALDPQPGDRVLDTCAAPGGKTMFCASRMQGKGFLTALDASASRLQALQRQAEAAGIPKDMLRTRAVDLREFAKGFMASLDKQKAPAAVQTGTDPAQAELATSPASVQGTDQAANTGAQPSPMSAAAGGPPSTSATAPASASSPAEAAASSAWDCVLLDAPCSGTGVLAKRADMRWRRTAQDVEEVLVPLQAELLDSAALLVRPGGLMVYSICSMEEDEGPQQIAAFLARHANFRHEPIDASSLACLGGDGAQAVINAEGCIATFPHRHGVVDGSFAARLRRLS